MQALLVAVLALAVVATAFPQQQIAPRVIPVLRKTEVRDDVGQFALSYATGDGQAFSEQGALKPNVDGEYRGDYALVKQGSYSYTAPDGTPVHITYTADENGFQPHGDVIPVAPVDPAHTRVA